MSVMAILYTLLAWGVILFAPRFLIGIFSSDQAADHRCDPGTETVLRSLCFSGTPVCGTDDVQVTGQEKIRDFLLSASQGHHRGSAYLHPSVSVPYGK